MVSTVWLTYSITVSEQRHPKHAQYFERAARDTAMAARFKLIAKAVNSSELGIGSFLETYNGKPVLIKNGTVHRGDNYFELDVNVHTWGMLARKTLKKMQPWSAAFKRYWWMSPVSRIRLPFCAA